MAQNLQVGTKTAPGMWVAFYASQSALPHVRQDIEQRFMALWTACHDAGLHPLALPILSCDINGIDTGTLSWEVRLPLADQLDPAALPDKPDLHVKQLAPAKVAFSYTAGDPWEAMGKAFGQLRDWAVDQKLDVTTQARAIIYAGLFGDKPEDVITECQLELKEQ